jgi:hypothetical protein
VRAVKRRVSEAKGKRGIKGGGRLKRVLFLQCRSGSASEPDDSAVFLHSRVLSTPSSEAELTGWQTGVGKDILVGWVGVTESRPVLASK